MLRGPRYQGTLSRVVEDVSRTIFLSTEEFRGSSGGLPEGKLHGFKRLFSARLPLDRRFSSPGRVASDIRHHQ